MRVAYTVLSLILQGASDCSGLCQDDYLDGVLLRWMMRSITLSPHQVGSSVHIPPLPFYVTFLTSTDEIQVDLAHCFHALIFLATGE